MFGFDSIFKSCCQGSFNIAISFSNYDCFFFPLLRSKGIWCRGCLPPRRTPVGGSTSLTFQAHYSPKWSSSPICPTTPQPFLPNYGRSWMIGAKAAWNSFRFPICLSLLSHDMGKWTIRSSDAWWWKNLVPFSLLLP